MTNIFIYNTLPKSLFHCPLSFLCAGAVFKVAQIYVSAKILKPRVKDRSHQFPFCCMRFCTPAHQSNPSHKHSMAILKFCDPKYFTSWKYNININQNQLRKSKVTSANCLNSRQFIIAVLDVTVTYNNVT